MGIEIVKDYEFENEQFIAKNITEEVKSNLQIQSGTYNFGHPFFLHWSLYIENERIEVTFNRTDRSSYETRILNKDNPTTSFGGYAPYDRISISLETLFDNRQLILNGIRCVRIDLNAKWFCSRYTNIIVTSW